MTLLRTRGFINSAHSKFAGGKCIQIDENFTEMDQMLSGME